MASPTWNRCGADRENGRAALVESIGILGTCIKEAGVCQPQAGTRPRRRFDAHDRFFRSRSDNVDIEQIMRQIRRGSARSAASITPKRRFGSWRASSSRSSSIHAGPLGSARAVPEATRRGAPASELRVSKTRRCSSRIRRGCSASCAGCWPDPQALVHRTRSPGAAHPVSTEHARAQREEMDGCITSAAQPRHRDDRGSGSR